jgi:hypothetical protein
MKNTKRSPFSTYLRTCCFLMAWGMTVSATGAVVSSNGNFNIADTLILDYGTFAGQKSTGQVVTLNKFDPGLGYLHDVTFNLNSALKPATFASDIRLHLVAFGSSPGRTPGEATATSEFTVSIFDGITPGSLFANTYFNTAYCYTPNNICQDSDTSNAGALFNAVLDADPLAEYVGPGTFGANVSQLIDMLIVPHLPGDPEASFNGYWSGNLEVVYTYGDEPLEVVPLPAAVWLFATSLLGLVVARKIKARRQPAGH